MKEKYSEEDAEKSLRKARAQMDEYDRTKNESLLRIAYANVGFATWYGLDTKQGIERLKGYGVDVSKILDWKPNSKITHEHFGF